MAALSATVSKEMRAFIAGAKTAGQKIHKTVAEQRVDLEAFMSAFNVPSEVQLQDFVLANRPARKYTPPNATANAGVLCLHGGGYRVGSLNAYNSFMSYISLACQAPVFGLDYRLAPESRYPAALDDAVAAFVELSEIVPPKKMMILGDSAGGGLALACLLRLKDQGLHLSGCATFLSPFLDATCSGASYGDLRAEFRQGIQQYVGDFPLETVGVSPLFGDHIGLPPILIQAATDESMVDDSVLFQARAIEAGVDSRIELFANAFHVFQIFTDIPEARQAIAGIGKFFKQHIRH